MLIQDPIYGEFEVHEPVLIELINSATVQRLKRIWQQGLPPEYYFMPTFTRYDHSIGVFLILRKLEASLEEQIAGLLHDTSHTAFSHVVDCLFKNKDETYGDDILEEFLSNTEVPKILEKHNYNFKEIINKDFYLLEKEAPDICADRLDYTLREMYFIRNKHHAKHCFNSLIVKNKEIIFRTAFSAEVFAKNYFELQKQNWGSIESALIYELLAKLLKYCLENNIITKADLHKDDYSILDILFNCKDDFVRKEINRITNTIEYELCEENYDDIFYKKFRYIDPKFLDKDGQVKRYSEINPPYLEDLKTEKEKYEKGYKVKFLK